MLTLLHKGYKGEYFADDIIFILTKKGTMMIWTGHINMHLDYGALVKKEVLGRKNFLYYFKFLKRIFRSIAGIILTKNRKYHKTVLKGRIEGFNKYK